MPRRYLFAVVDGGGNVPPELGAARRLIERGHMVTVITDDSVGSEAGRRGPSPGGGFVRQIDRIAGPRTIQSVTGSARIPGSSSTV